MDSIVIKKEDVGKKISDYMEEVSKESIAYSVDNIMVHPNYHLQEGDQVIGYPVTTHIGYRIYVKSLFFLLATVMNELYPEVKLEIAHTISRSMYCYLKEGKTMSLEMLDNIKNRMKQIVAADIHFTIENMPRQEAVDYMKGFTNCDEKWLYGKRFPEVVPMYSLGADKDYFYSPLVARTGVLHSFDLKDFMPGFLLQLPSRIDENELFDFHEFPKLFDIILETETWNHIMDVGYVSSLNQKIKEGKGTELILIGEALQEKKIAYIADRLKRHSDKYQMVLVAGPSSSGKTTFTHKLEIALKANELEPISISMDDYYFPREKTPLGDDGKPDFESVHAIDIALLQNDLEDLIQGKTIEVPTYNFVTGEREYTGKLLTKHQDAPIIMEGIHGLNPVLTNRIPRHLKYLIFVSSLAQLNLDPYNRLRTSDARLLRRMVRDARERNTPAERTLKFWGKVRRGEEENVFKFQENADIHFNSHLPYELSVLKTYAEPLLREIEGDSPQYLEARYLLNILNYFDPLDDSWVPPFSILREMIGINTKN